MFFLESCLLVLLRSERGYGYSLMSGLEAFGFQPDVMDISVLYRALRELEAAGLISGSWDEEQKSLGPQRRVYMITEQGAAALEEWMQGLRQRREEIEALEAAYGVVKPRG